MDVYGISRVKDEVDVIGSTIRRMLAEVDRIIVVDNSSTDGTRDVLADLEREHPGNLFVLDDAEVAYYQSQAMTRLADKAAEYGAAWVVPFDADEVWYAPPSATIAETLRLYENASIVSAALYDHVATGADPEASDPVERIGWRRRKAAPLPKVAVRTRSAVRIHQGNHNADFGDRVEGLVVRHFPYRSPEQMVRKAVNGAAAYAATDLPEDIGAHWRQYGALVHAHGPEALHDVFRKHFWVADPASQADLIFDPCPASKS